MTSVAVAIRDATGTLRDGGVGDTPQLDAELLVGHVAGLDRVGVRTRGDRELTDAELERVERLVERRLAGEPVAYLLGTAWFHGIEFEVDRRVLVPRPETELLVQLALEHLRAWRGVRRVVDVGTGSGCIAVAIARSAPPPTHVLATDVSPDALDVATANVRRTGADVVLLEGDLLAPVLDSGPFAAIVSNPPYVEGVDADGLDPGVRDHEPHVALFTPAGATVDDAYSRLAHGARHLLAPGGMLAVEHGMGQRVLVEAAFTRAGLVQVHGVDDLAGIDRVVVGYRGAEEDAR